MEGTEDTIQDVYLQEELASIGQTSQSRNWANQAPVASVWTSHLYSQDPMSDQNKHRFNHYADKLLWHLIVEEEFNFQKIAGILSNPKFKNERNRYTERSCRERWEELYSLRKIGKGVKEKRLEDKRASSVSTFSDPYSLYNLEEMLQKLKATQHQSNSSLQEPHYEGYNIFKDSIREITDMQSHKKRERQMLEALKYAQDHTVTDKLMHFEPYYERLNQFEVKEEELTEEKMKEIMSNPIEMEYLEKELRVKDMNEVQKGWKNKRFGMREEDKEKEHEYDIEDNWDQYQSD